MRKDEYNRTPTQIVSEKLEAGRRNRARIFVGLPDCPHVGKSMEVAFSNWWLKYNGEPINFDKDFDKDFDKSLKQRNERHHPKKQSC